MQTVTNGVYLYVEDSGVGNPLLLVHGFPLNHTIWMPLLPHLHANTRVILPDLRGHGLSEAPQGVYMMELIAEDLAGVLDALEVSKCVLVGHSMGGYAALAFAKKYPQRLSGLGLVTTHARSDTPEQKIGRLKTAEEIRVNGVATLAENMSKTLTAHSDLKGRIREIILQTPVEGVIGALQGMSARGDRLDELPQITVPSMVLLGENDQVIPTEYAEEMYHALPNSELVRISMAGHMPMMETPIATAAALNRLLERVYS